MKIILKQFAIFASVIFSILTLVGCDETNSYADLLTAEEQAANWYLSHKNVENDIPVDSVFKTGTDAPFYKMDNEGFVYMQVVNPGDANLKPQKGDRVLFTFERMSINYFHLYGKELWEGNSENLDTSLGSTSLVYGNSTLPSTTQYGDGIQIPLQYLGYNSEVNILIKSPMGFTTDISQCNGYVYNVRYFKAEY